MRSDISSTVLDAASAASVNISVRGIAYKSRSIFRYADLDATYQTSYAHGKGIETAPLCQAFTYSQARSNGFAVYRGPSYRLYAQECGAADFQVLYSGSPITIDRYSRPGIISDEESYDTIFYYHSGSIWRVKLADGTAEVSEKVEIAIDKGSCALYPITTDQVIVLWIGEGGIGISIVYEAEGNWYYEDCPRRLFNPTTIYTGTDEELYSLHFAGAVYDYSDDSTYVYISREDGSVTGIWLSLFGNWSEFFVAVPADLSKFAIANVTQTHDGNAIMCGQFQRVDDIGSFESSYIYNLALWSEDKRTFSLDRNVLFAIGDEEGTDNEDLLAIRFMFAVDSEDPGTVWFNDAGRWLTDDAPYWASGEYSDSETIDPDKIEKFSGDYQKFSISLANSDEAFSTDEFIREGNRFLVQLGYKTSGGTSWINLVDTIIAGIATDEMDGHRNIDLTLEPVSMWRASRMTHPFYLEIQSKQSRHDDISAWDGLYPAVSSIKLSDYFSVDFWDSGTRYCEVTGPGSTDEWTTDVLTNRGFSELPKITELPFTVEIYGWSRAGNLTPWDTPSDSNADNAVVRAVLYILDEDGNRSTIELSSYNSTNDNWFQTYVKTAAGDDPVIMNAREEDGLSVGDTIEKVGVILENTNSTDPVTSYIARVDIPDVPIFRNIPDTTTWEDITDAVGILGSFTFDESTEGWYFEDASTGYGLMEGEWSDSELVFNSVRGFTIWNKGYWYLDGQDTVAHEGATFDISYEVTVTSNHEYGLGIEFEGGYATIESDLSVSDPEPIVIPSSHEGAIVSRFYIWSNVRGKHPRCFAVQDITLTGFDLPVYREYTGKKLLKPGEPKICFSTSPYSTFNCEVSAAFKQSGDSMWAGVVCLAKDGDNYIVARMSWNRVELLKFRDGIGTLLATDTYESASDYRRILLRHSDGNFKVFVSDSIDNFNAPDWGQEKINYDWTEADGDICVDDDIMHVGTYMFMNLQWVRICGYEPGSGCVTIGIMPGGGDFGGFPSAGDLYINGQIVSYDELFTMQGGIMGPYQCIATFHNQNYTNGETYTGSSIHIGQFNGLGNGYWDAYVGWLMSSSIGYSYEITKTDLSPYEDVLGTTVYLRERIAHFADNISGDVHGVYQKMWITRGFGGVAANEGNSQSHPEGSVAFEYDADNVLALLEFSAHSGHTDATVEDMLDKILRIAGGEAKFPGDIETSSVALVSGTPTEIT